MTLSHYLRAVDMQARMLLRAEASRYKLGVLWWFLEPLLWVAVFFVVFNLILESARRGGDFIIFLACGKFAFIWFSKSVTQASNSIATNNSLIGKINVPKSLFPMAAIQEGVYRQLAVYGLLGLILVFGGYPVSLAWLWLLPVAFVFYLMIVACSFVGACLVCWVRDFSKFIPLGMMFLLFTSGIFWDIRELGDPEKIELILNFNPMAFILDAHRQVLMRQSAPDLLHLFKIGLGAVVIIAAMVSYMRRKSQYLALKVLT